MYLVLFFILFLFFLYTYILCRTCISRRDNLKFEHRFFYCNFSLLLLLVPLLLLLLVLLLMMLMIYEIYIGNNRMHILVTICYCWCRLVDLSEWSWSFKIINSRPRWQQQQRLCQASTQCRTVANVAVLLALTLLLLVFVSAVAYFSCFLLWGLMIKNVAADDVDDDYDDNDFIL